MRSFLCILWTVCSSVLFQLNLWRHNSEELVEVILPKSIVCQAIMITLVSHQMAHVEVIHTEVCEPVPDGIGKSFYSK